jgi:hypothetical protein
VFSKAIFQGGFFDGTKFSCKQAQQYSMYRDDVIQQVRAIAKNHYEGMKALDMGNSEPVVQKKDLAEQLQARLSGFAIEELSWLYTTLELKGYATLITNDTVTFSKDFIGE